MKDFPYSYLGGCVFPSDLGHVPAACNLVEMIHPKNDITYFEPCEGNGAKDGEPNVLSKPRIRINSVVDETPR
jgi:hypothetical protein